MSETTPAPITAETTAILATEWFKLARRLLRLAARTPPESYQREKSQIDYARGKIADLLETHGMHLEIYDSTPFSPEIPPEPVNPEDFDGAEGLVVSETLEPTVLFDGRVVLRGHVVLAHKD